MKINTRKLKNFFTQIPRILVENFFSTFLFLFLVSIILGFLILKNSLSFKEEKSLKFEVFKEKTYKRVVEKFREKERKFEEISHKRYLNPFKEK